MKAPSKANDTIDELATRIRDILGNDPHVTEKNMFGGLTFLHNGHILIGTKKDGRILLSVGKQNNDAALARPGATQMLHNNRSMTGFIWVEADAIEDPDDLRDWVSAAYGWVSKMAADKPKPAKKAAAKLAARKPPAKKPVAKAAARKTP